MRSKVITLGVLVIIVIVLGFFLGNNTQVSKATEKDNYIDSNDLPIYHGKWIVTKRIQTSGIYAMSDEDAASLIGKELYYSFDTAIVDKKIYENLYYEEDVIKKDEFFSLFKFDSTELEIDDETIIVIDIKDSKGHFWYGIGSFLIIKGKDSLITYWDGVFFELNRKE